jgi:mRNA interferase RelE/StbE
MLGLGDDPHPPGSRKLSGYADIFRIRVGVFRVVYSVDGRKVIVIILKIGHRKDVYR